MIGSTIIFEKNPAKLLEIDIDDLDSLVIVELDVMITLDFEELVEGAELQWCEDAPVRFEEEEGLAILKITPEGLRFVTEIGDGLEEEKLDDIRKLKTFVEQHGFENIYELTTF